jgi:hypothetical protein
MEVLDERVERGQAPGLTAVGLHAVDAAQLHARAPRRFLGRHPGLDEVVRVGLDMEPDLLRHAVFEFATAPA